MPHADSSLFGLLSFKMFNTSFESAVRFVFTLSGTLSKFCIIEISSSITSLGVVGAGGSRLDLVRVSVLSRIVTYVCLSIPSAAFIT